MARFFHIALILSTCCLAQDDKPAPTIPDLEKDANAVYMNGDYEASRQILLKAWDLASHLPNSDPLRYDVLKRLSTVRSAAGEFEDADSFLQQAISWREQILGLNDPKTVDDVLISVGYARGRKDFQHALMIMNRVMGLHRAANVASGSQTPLNSINIADDYSRIAQIQAEMSATDPTKVDAAIASLTAAIAIRSNVLGQFEPSLVYDLDRMAGLQIVQRAYGKAEQTYRYALVIRETLYGKMHPDLISTVDGLAYSLFGQKRYDDAEPVYKRLLALWIDSVKSETHPMVAIACDKLATFYADQKKWDEAKENKTRANAIRAFLLAEGYSEEGSQRIEEGKLADALIPYRRALAVMDVPNPVYDEQHAIVDSMVKEIEKVTRKPVSPPPARSKKQ